jgi:hypothetical protein
MACNSALNIEGGSVEPAADGGGDADGGGAETSTADAAADAGPCARTCLGTACLGGRCEPQRLTEGLGKIRALALDDTAVYFISFDRGSLGRISKGGGAVTFLLPEGTTTLPTSLLLDGPWIYLSAYAPGNTSAANAGARRIPRDGGTAEVIDRCNTGYSVAVDATNVYWVTADCGSAVVLRRRPKDDPDAAAVVSALPESKTLYSYGFYGNAALDETNVYWVNKARVNTLPKADVEDAGPLTFFDPDAGTKEHFRALAVADRVYALLGHRVLAATKGGASVTTTVLVDAPAIAAEQAASLILDDTHVYFTQPERGVVARVPRAGGAVETLASGQAKPSALALDASYIYWGNEGDGAIWRVAR